MTTGCSASPQLDFALCSGRAAIGAGRNIEGRSNLRPLGGLEQDPSGVILAVIGRTLMLDHRVGLPRC